MLCDVRILLVDDCSKISLSLKTKPNIKKNPPFYNTMENTNRGVKGISGSDVLWPAISIVGRCNVLLVELLFAK